MVLGVGTYSNERYSFRATTSMRLDAGVRQDRLQLGAEDELVPDERVVEGFVPETISGEEQLSRGSVPDREREHPVEVADAVGTELLVGVDHDLGVGAGLEPMSQLRKEGTKALVVVDLAVEDDPDRAVFVGDGLMAALDVDDRQPPRREADSAVEKRSFIVRPPVGDGPGHGVEHQSLRPFARCRIEYSADATHERSPKHISCGRWRRIPRRWMRRRGECSISQPS
jgi:hypothetical protein